MGSRRISKDEANHYGGIVWNYFEKFQKYKAVKSKFDAIKSDFETEMEGLFHGRDSRSLFVANYNLEEGEPNMLKVTKVERTSIKWDVDKLRKRISKDVFKKVVHKEYKVVGMPQLIKYLKSCGVDPEVFKQYIVVEESVDQEAVDRMGELGYLSAKQVSGCYIVDCAKPYFTVSLVKGKRNE